jgi:hypothetical protein
MAQYKSFIDTIYTTINDKSKSDVEKSNIIIDGIQKIMLSKSDIKPESPDSKVSCSSFSNSVVQFVCKLDKSKDKLCNLPGAVTWVIGKDKINAIISFITTNKAFVETIWQRFQNDNDKNQLNNLLVRLPTNTQINSNTPSCINNVQNFLDNLRQLSATSLSRPLSIASTASMSDLTSNDSNSRPSSVTSVTSLGSTASDLTSNDSNSRPSSVTSVTSVGSLDSNISSLSSTTNSSDSSDINKRYGQRFSSPVTSTPIERNLTNNEKNPSNMWSEFVSSSPTPVERNLTEYEKNPSNMWSGGVRKSRKHKKTIRKIRKNKKNKYTKRHNKRNSKRK